MTRAAWIALLWLLAVPVFAVIETYSFSHPELESRYRQLSAELRCPKCQNQNIADSNAPIAQDLRRELHRQLEAGASDSQILEFMAARYGEFVLYRPRYDGPTRMLWLAPFILLLLAVVVAAVALRRSRNNGAGNLEDHEQQRIAKLLHDRDGEHK